MKISLVQLNYIIGDLEYNFQKMEKAVKEAPQDAELLLFSEMSITGYPPMDLIENSTFIDRALEYAHKVAALSDERAIVFGYIDRGSRGELYNAAAFAHNGKIQHTIHKTLLPTYDVFDEHRYFRPAERNRVIMFKGERIGLTICEDIWNAEVVTKDGSFTDFRFYDADPVADLAEQGVTILLNLSASPFVSEKAKYRRELITAIAKKYHISVLYCNQVGGNDSLIFDGDSFALSSAGVLNCRAAKFKEDCVMVDTRNHMPVESNESLLDDLEDALVLGLRDYVTKCGFKRCVLGLSGGIDSAVTAVLAVKALGKENVMGITMPSTYSSSGSVDDSVALAENLGIRIEEIAIQPVFETYNNSLAPIFTGYEWDVTEENLQARIRGTLLMAASNKFGALLLTTGNKSELAMGYCTLYGDMNGGLAVISDVPKTLVYELAEHFNRDGEVVPYNTISKPPSAELRENQKDEDSLPPYDVLDEILREHIENRKSIQAIVDLGFDREIVEFVVKNVDRNEYKRRQAAPGLKITSKAFGVGRRIPMAQGYRH